MGPDAEDGPGPQWAAPKQFQPVFQMQGFVTKDERGIDVGAGDSYVAGGADADVERRRRKRDGVRVW